MTKEQKDALARARGRPALPEELRTIPGTVRLTPARWEKLRLLGAAWLSQAIDRAKIPKE
ncbi:hypothetical protein [Variovorax sp. DXTD-1]|uniref:hypothetical protein n=1 Tax=Variovorax sp. DXTD-1 TaxID=2495592 RepID=UPI000F869858|nr:hypothetical protein [Variovorax sp. DXTD-1]RST51587.1 hypothetical protein EJI00_08415 [Variovorax sp. DXTD-1]